jgi:phage-related protein
VAGKAQLTIDVTATTAGAVADLDKAKRAVKDYGDAADTATKQSKDVSGAIDSVGGVAGGATSGLRDMSDAIAMAGFPELAAGMGVTATALESLDGAATLYAAAQEGLTKAVGIFDGIMKALKLTILTNPIFIIAAIIIAVGAAFVIAYKNCETFRNIVDAAVRVVWDTIKTVFNWIKDNWELLFTIMTGPFGLAVTAIIKNRDSIWDAIKAVYNWIKDTWDAISGFLSAPFKAAWDTIRGIFDKIEGAIHTVLDLIGKIKIPKGITDFIGAINPFNTGMPAPAGFAAPGVARASSAAAHTSSSGGGITINVTTTGLGADAPQIQRAVVNALRGHVARNGPLDFAVRAGS